MREAFHDRLRAPKTIILRHETILDVLARGAQALGAKATFWAARQGSYRRPKPRRAVGDGQYCSTSFSIDNVPPLCGAQSLRGRSTSKADRIAAVAANGGSVSTAFTGQGA